VSLNQITDHRETCIFTFLLDILEFWAIEILMGAPIGCPNRH
jgi:hypothetical protein